MDEAYVKDYLRSTLKFSQHSLDLLSIYVDELLKYNKKYNLISKSSENNIWGRHILDSAQLIKHISFNDNVYLLDLGSGAGFPGMVIAIYNQNPSFHVKLLEKSPVKCDFLSNIVRITDKDVKICKKNAKDIKFKYDIITARAFRKIPYILDISREIVNKNHQIIIMKGKNAQEDIDSALKTHNFSYKLRNSVTEKKSKIIIIENNKSE